MAVEKAIGSSSLVEVVDRILDKGIVIDAWAKVSLVGIELLSVEVHVVRVRREVVEIRRDDWPQIQRRGSSVDLLC
jgi:hypothetical protein